MKIMVLSPHPDDETLGAGGSLLKYKAEGHKIFWLNITDMREEYGYPQERVEERSREIEQVRQAYGFDGFYNLKLKPAGIDEYQTGDLITQIKNVLDEVKPEVLILPYGHDVHSDHKIIFDAAYSCTKSFRAPYLKQLLCMEIISETDQALENETFHPNMYVDITSYLDRKVEILKTYKSEIKNPPFPRNEDAVRGLAALRGATAGYRYSEAFRLLKYYVE